MRAVCIVTLKSGEAFRGVLFDVDARALVLRNAEQMQARGDRSSVAVDGEVLVLVGDVAYVQILTNESEL